MGANVVWVGPRERLERPTQWLTRENGDGHARRVGAETSALADRPQTAGCSEITE